MHPRLRFIGSMSSQLTPSLLVKVYCLVEDAVLVLDIPVAVQLGAVAILATRFAKGSVNQTLPSGAAAIPKVELLPGVGSGYSVMEPDVDTRPTL
jgi:hypothetical protein